MKPELVFLDSFLKIAKADAKANRYWVQATTDDVDRQGERVIPSGIRNLDHFLKYGSILYAHNWAGFPIGKPTDGKVSEKSLLIELAFAETELGLEAKYLYDEGFLSSFSIGFLPDFEKIDVIDNVRTYKAWDLLELSGVPVPANAFATILREAESRRGAPLAVLAKMLSTDHSQMPGSPSSAAADLKAPQQNAESPLVSLADKKLQPRSRLWTS